MRLQDRGFTYAGGSSGGFKSNGQLENIVIVTANPKMTARSGEKMRK